MRKENKASDDTLRPHYDLDNLEIVKLGPGWVTGSTRRMRGPRAARRFYASQLAPAIPLFSAPRVDKDLLSDFFMIFARVEYALKEAKYFTADSNGMPVTQWEVFAAKIGDSLLASKEPAIRAAVKYLSENPPQKQVVKNKTLTWKPRKSDNPRDPVFLIRSITTVRNNLFHGGKEREGPLAESNRRLLESCLDLLSFAISLDPDVLHSFEELPREIEVA
jgi:hypothetical protein